MSEPKKSANPTHQEMALASALLLLVGLVAIGAWFAKSDTLLGSIIQAGVAWCL